MQSWRDGGTVSFRGSAALTRSVKVQLHTCICCLWTDLPRGLSHPTRLSGAGRAACGHSNLQTKLARAKANEAMSVARVEAPHFGCPVVGGGSPLGAITPTKRRCPSAHVHLPGSNAAPQAVAVTIPPHALPDAHVLRRRVPLLTAGARPAFLSLSPTALSPHAPPPC